MILPVGLRRSGSAAPLWVWHSHWPSTHHLLLIPGLLLLLLLNCCSSSFDQRILDRSCYFRKEYRFQFQRSRHGLFPGLQHLIQLLAYLVVDQAISVHKDTVQIAAKKQRVRCTNVFYHGVQYIQCWKFPVWGRLSNNQYASLLSSKQEEHRNWHATLIAS